MNKIFKALVCVFAVLFACGIGVYAAINNYISFSAKSRVYFTVNSMDIEVEINGEIKGGSSDPAGRTYQGSRRFGQNDEIQENIPAWTIGAIHFTSDPSAPDESKFAISYILTVKNIGGVDIEIIVSFDGLQLPAAITLESSGGENTTEQILQSKTDRAVLGAATLTQVSEVTLEYKLILTDQSQPISATPFNFNVELNKIDENNEAGD